MRVLFMGADPIVLGVVAALKARGSALLVVSQPDRPVGRGQKLTPNPVSQWALDNSVSLLRPEKLDDAFNAQLKEFAPDITIVMAYGRLLKQPVLDLAPLGIWNLHASLLPTLRGASPIETAIAMGEKQTGVTLMRIVMKMDAGAMGPKEVVAISPTVKALELREELSHAATRLIEKHWQALVAGTLPTVEQPEEAATYCRILTKDDGWLDFNASAEELANRVRAFAEFPGAGFEFKGERLKVFEARAVDGQYSKGCVVEAGEKLVVGTGEGALELTTLQRPGGKRLSAKEFLRGYPIAVGEFFEGKPLRPLVGPQSFPRGF